MAFSVSAKLDGLEPFLRNVARLQVSMRKKILRKAATEANRIFLRAAKANLIANNSVRTKILLKSLGSKVRSYNSGSTIVVMMGPRTGYKTAIGVRTRGRHKGQVIYENPTQIAHLVEKGTKFAAAKPFMRPAFDEKKAEAEAKAAETMQAMIAAEPYLQ